MAEDIFDKIEGYEQLHEILRVLNKVMVDCERVHNGSPRINLQLNFNVETDNEIKRIDGITIECHKDIETITEIANINFVAKTEKQDKTIY